MSREVDKCKPLAPGGDGAHVHGCERRALRQRGAEKTAGDVDETRRLPHLRVQGGAAQVDPMKPELKAPVNKRLKLKCDEPLSNFAFKFNLR